jgi:cyclic beta-1,2-glucan synthetase
MITNTGAGYSRWGEFDITRWRSDTSRDNWGTFVYLRETESNTLWSVTHQPLNVKDPRYTATFSADRAEFRRRRLGIESHLEVTVSPEDDAEIRRITLVNHGSRARTLELTSAAELSLAPHDTDRAHPAFSKLFIQTEARADLHAPLAWRRLRSPMNRRSGCTVDDGKPQDEELVPVRNGPRASLAGTHLARPGDVAEPD